MFCPKCGVLLLDADLIQRNVKYAMGNVAVEYDAKCPNCNIEIGRMSWGQFTIHPGLAQTHYEDDQPVRAKESLIPPPPELRTVLRQYGAAGRNKPAAVVEGPVEEALPMEPEPRVCPHCGRLWPEIAGGKY